MTDPAKFIPVRVRIAGVAQVKEAMKTMMGVGLGCLGAEALFDKPSRWEAAKTLGCATRKGRNGPDASP